MKAIIIDDNESKVVLINCLIKPFVTSIIRVGAIAEALPLLTTDQYNYIFLDHNLPDGKGTDHIEYFRDQQFDAKFISVSDDMEIAVNHQQLGYDDILQHPFKKSLDRIFKN